MKPAKARLVYSSEGGPRPPAECRKCGAHPCRCEPVRPLFDRDRSLRIVPQREAGDAQVCRLLLDAPGIGDGNGGPEDQVHEFDVTEWVDEPDVGRGKPLIESLIAQARARPRMHREDDGQAVPNSNESLDERRQFLGLVDIGRSMQRYDGIVLAEAQSLDRCRRLDLGAQFFVLRLQVK
jgi:hypothetical protein